MALETGSFISDLVATNPPSTDDKRQGDDHLRLIKGVLKTTFPALDAAVTAEPAGLNRLDSEGITLEFTTAVAPATGEATVFRDGSAQLVKIDGDAPYNSAQPVGCPIGVMLPYLGSGAVPGGWLYCNGAEVSRTTYARLFAVIGDVWGIGDGSTTFNLPDFSQYSFPAGTLTMPSAPSANFDGGYLSSTVNGAELFWTDVNWIIKF